MIVWKFKSKLVNENGIIDFNLKNVRKALHINKKGKFLQKSALKVPRPLIQTFF